MNNLGLVHEKKIHHNFLPILNSSYYRQYLATCLPVGKEVGELEFQLVIKNSNSSYQLSRDTLKNSTGVLVSLMGFKFDANLMGRAELNINNISLAF